MKRQKPGPQNKKKQMTVLSITKHLTKEAKKKEEKKTAQKQKEPDLVPEKLKKFAEFYKGISLVPEEEWRLFMKENTGRADLTFRFIARHWRCPSHLDTVPGIPSQTDVIIDYMRKKFGETINKMVANNVQLSLSALPWYPNDYGWTMNIDHGDMGKYLGLKDFYFFLNSEKTEFTVQRLEAWSMLPPLLLKIQPHHKVLDLCASPGFMAGQISQIMHSDPNSTTGVLVLNNLWKFNDKMEYKWCQGTKAIFINNNAKSFPDLFISETKEVLKYDRVLCDVKCSSDGTMRKHPGLQDHWNSNTALEYHGDQLAVLRRGMELVTQGGMVLYCTTSLNPIENEAVVMAMLKEASGTVDLVDIRRLMTDFKFRPGMNTWKVMSQEGFFYLNYAETSDEFKKNFPESVFPPKPKEALAFRMERCARVLPHDNSTSGFFCALLTKTRELPWVKAKQQEKAKAAPKPQEEEKKKYGYALQLMPQVVLLEAEWTTEVTNRFLQTRTKVEKQLFPIPPHVVDPSCVPKQLINIHKTEVDEAFGFFSPDDDEWFKIKSFFKISDNFDANTLIRRNDGKEWFLSSLFVRKLIKNNLKHLQTNISPNAGVQILHLCTDLWIPCDTTCPYMFTEEGFAAMFPYIGKQVVNVTGDDILALAYHEKLKISQLSEKAQADIKETEQGCILFVYRPADFNAIPRCNLTFVGARGENYIIDYKDGKTIERKNTFRLFGIEMEDYRRKIQEEKLAKVLEMERQKAAGAVAMDTN